MIVQIEVYEYITENTYIYADDKRRRGFLIDPGAEAGRILKIAADYGVTIEKILLTHGHFDHIGAVDEIACKLDIPVFMHENGKCYIRDPERNGSAMFDFGIELGTTNFLQNGEIIDLEYDPFFSVELIATPGHSLDSVIYYSERDGVAFVGDTIFRGGFGRTDLFGGDFNTLMKSIRTKILTLPDETILYSGHSDPTTVGEEKNFFRE